ncbi:MAG: hypothetical protein KGO48_14280 [Alphaproteobacteria bacterium]|nr:hypothetical protein [Alphaproteobacteria bacterium]
MRSVLPKLGMTAGIFVSLSLVAGAPAQPANVPNFWVGDAGWVHPLNYTFPPVQGSPSPVVQDPGHPFGRDSWRIGDVTNPNLKPWVKQAMQKDNDEINHGKIAFQARSSCLPSGIPNLFLPGNPLLILQTPKEVLMIKEGGQEVRHVYLDVPHSPGVKPSWYGESVGHYEGDTLVVDTIGQNAKTVLDAFRTPHTGKLHVIERWRITDGGKTLEANITVDDPDTFNQPWSSVIRHRRGQEPFYEDICQENNLNLFDYHMPVANTADF